MFVKSLLVCAFVALNVSSVHSQDINSPEIYYFFDETNLPDLETQGAIKHAVEQGFRIRSIAANRFPNLAKRFQVRKLPSLLLLRRNKLAARHEGRFTFGRLRELIAKVRENRIERRDRIREMIVGGGGSRKNDAPTSVPPLAPRYIQTSSNTPVSELASSSRLIPKPLDRNGRFAVAHMPSQAEAVAFGATVRIRVVDPGGTSHGTGTIIHSSGRDALVLTCGHIFRESRGRGRIEADVMFSSNMQTVGGRLISFDSNAHDIALLTIRTPVNIPPAKIARSSRSERLHADVFTIGCDKGNRPTIRRSHFKRTALYDGVQKYDVYGRPIDGRSGGGLFNDKGELIGVCNAAAVHTDEGIYSGLKTIYHQLSKSHLSHLFNEAYWNSGIRSRNALENVKQSNGDARFQSLPANPALAFAQSGKQMIPVNQRRSEPVSSERTASVNTEPRIPMFNLSSLTENRR